MVHGRIQRNPADEVVALPETRPSDYDSFAWFYNRYWGSGSTAFAARVLPVLQRLFLPEIPAGWSPARSVLRVRTTGRGVT